jgi:hypothetical protein
VIVRAHSLALVHRQRHFQSPSTLIRLARPDELLKAYDALDCRPSHAENSSGRPTASLGLMECLLDHFSTKRSDCIDEV